MTKMMFYFVLAAFLTTHSLAFFPSSYHTTKQLNDKINKIVSKCNKFITKKSFDSLKIDPSTYSPSDFISKAGDLFYLDIKIGEPKTKLVIISGEHPRELIAVEVLLNVVDSLCYSPDQCLNK